MESTNKKASPWDYTYDDYFAVLSGSKRLQAGRQRRIAIIGAGMAGLVAGSLLKQAGHEVEVFEAKHKVGGRIKTLRERFTSDFYAEAGAMRIPDHHKLTKWLAYKLFRLKSLPFTNANQNGLIYINNQQTTVREYENNPGVLKFELEKQEIKPAHHIFDKCLESFIQSLPGNDKTTINWKRFSATDLRYGAEKLSIADIEYLMKELDPYSLRYFLAHVAKFKGKSLSQGAIDMISAVLVYEMELSCSMAFILSQYMEFNARKFTQIQGGMDGLPKALARGKDAFPSLSEELNYNSRVKEIVSEGPGFRLCVENTITSHEHPVPHFHRVIICVPFSALRHIRIAKGLTSPEKRRAIRQLHYANACKVLLEFENKFWLQDQQDRPKIEGGKSITDLAIRQIFYPTLKQNTDPSGRGILLASYTWGDDSLRWTSLRSDDRIRFALRDLERVYGSARKLSQSCIGGMSHSWAEDEFTSGAFAQIEPDQIKLFDHIWQPEMGIHYAGEHTSLRFGWIEGAVESGIRAAKEVCDALALEDKTSQPSSSKRRSTLVG